MLGLDSIDNKIAYYQEDFRYLSVLKREMRLPK